MTKSERLLYLIRLMREGKGIRLRTLSETCGVSQRTIYRDLISLSRVNVPVRLERSGYKISRANSSLAILAEFPDERDMIRLILRTTELAKIEPFASRIASLDAQLGASHREGDQANNRTKIRFDGPFTPIHPRELNHLIIPFVCAIKQGAQVRFELFAPERVVGGDPKAVILSGDQTTFVYRAKGKRESAQLASTDLASITIVQKKQEKSGTKTG